MSDSQNNQNQKSDQDSTGLIIQKSNIDSQKCSKPPQNNEESDIHQCQIINDSQILNNSRLTQNTALQSKLKKRRNESGVWKYIKKENNKLICTYNNCTKEFSVNSGNSSLAYH